MPKTLSNRLEDLENEIHVMLMLHEPGGRCSDIIRGATITTRSDGNVDRFDFQGGGCCQESAKVTLPMPKANSKQRPSSSPEPRYRRHRSGDVLTCCRADEYGDAKNKERRSSSGGFKKVSYNEYECICAPPRKPPPCICGVRKEATLKKCICGPKGAKGSLKGNECAGSEGRVRRDSRKAMEGKKGGNEKVEKAGNEEENQKMEGIPEMEENQKQEGVQPATEGRKGSEGFQLKADQGLAAIQELQKLREEDEKRLAESEDLISQLKAKLERMEITVGQAERDKQLAMNMTSELKDKYDKLKTGKSAESDELAKIKKEREDLLKKLEKEAERRRSLEEKAKQSLEKERKSLAEKVEKVELKAVKSAKKVLKHSHTLASAVKQRDDHLRRISATTERLADTIRDKEFELKRLTESNKEVIQNFIEAQTANKKLAENNAALVRSIKEFQEKLQMEKSACQKTQKQLADLKEEARRANEETDRLKDRLKQVLQGPKDMREMARLQAKLREAREREKLTLDEAALYERKMKEARDSQETESKKSGDEMERMIKEYKKLQSKFETTVKKMQFEQEDHALKVQTMEEDFQAFSNEMRANLEKLEKEKEELQVDFDHLTEASLRDREVLQNLIVRTQQQDFVIHSQQDAIAEREEVIAQALTDIQTAKQEAVQLNKEINSLEESLKLSESALEESNRDNQEIRKQVQETREEIVRKDQQLAEQNSKIEYQNVTINDQNNKIQSCIEELRIAEGKAEQAEEQIREMSVKMEDLKEERDQYKSGIQIQNEEIKNKVVKLEETVEEFCRCVPGSPGGDAKEDKLVTSLQQKTELMQREAQLQMMLLEKQKDQAVNAAKFATQKLLETVTDFQDQIETHRKVQYALTKLVQEKEEELKKMCPRRCTSKNQKTRPRSAKSQCSNPNCGAKKFQSDTDYY